MHTRFDENDTARALIERRWFALNRAVGRLQEECADLGVSLQAAQDAWARSSPGRTQAAPCPRSCRGAQWARPRSDSRA